KFTDIEIVGDALGRPEVLLLGPALEIARKQGLVEIRVSISHTRELALAFAVGLTEGENEK
ncbi:MAG TPA: ACP synthase, partial [Verrucomicrobiae bacterium]|nr:ACP synthase [Verrucomicrobiae bacterium]